MLIPYIVPVFSRTTEKMKPAEKASRLSKIVIGFPGMILLPRWSTPKKMDTISIPLHLLIHFIALYWSKPLNASSSKKPVHTMKISSAMIKFAIPVIGQGLGLKIRYSISAIGKAMRHTPTSIGAYCNFGKESPTSCNRRPCSHMTVKIAMNIGMDTNIKQVIQLKRKSGIAKLSIRISGASTRAIRNSDKYLSLSDSKAE